jgi:hypothetical protein
LRRSGDDCRSLVESAACIRARDDLPLLRPTVGPATGAILGLLSFAMSSIYVPGDINSHGIVKNVWTFLVYVIGPAAVMVVVMLLVAPALTGMVRSAETRPEEYD